MPSRTAPPASPKRKRAQQPGRKLGHLPADEGAPVSKSVLAIRPLLAAATLAGMLCSHRLWVSSHRLFPLTPVWRGLPQPPFPADYILFGLALASLAGAGAWKRPSVFIKVFLILAGALVALDQSRLQPWLLEYSVMFGALLWLPWDRPQDWRERNMGMALHPCRWLLIWTYFYSGLQKVGHGFVNVLASMIAPMIARFHWSNALLSARVLRPAALVLGLAECISGLLLAFPRTRRPAVVCLILMHISLLLWLGPLALGWNSVVWPWNAAMIALLITLFWSGGKWGLRAMWRAHPYAKVVAVTFAVVPLLTILGIADSYMGFSLYSGNIKGAVVYVGPQHVSELPAAVRPYAKQDGILDLDSWSAAELGVPLYPETRVFASAGRQVALWVRSGAVVRVIELEKPDPLTGQRKASSFDPMTD